MLTEGVHSGDASGVVPSSLPHRAPAARPPRGRRDRRACSPTAFHAAIPERAQCEQATRAATVLGDEHRGDKFPFAGSTARRWSTGSGRAGAQPHLAAGARRSPAPTACRRSATPATCCARRRRSSCRCACRRRSTAQAPARTLKQLLETDPPYGATVTLRGRPGAPPAGTRRRPRRGSQQRVDAASQAVLRRSRGRDGRGRHDPVHGRCSARSFPQAQFLITGVLGPAVQCARPERVPAHRRMRRS